MTRRERGLTHLEACSGKILILSCNISVSPSGSSSHTSSCADVPAFFRSSTFHEAYSDLTLFSSLLPGTYATLLMHSLDNGLLSFQDGDPSVLMSHPLRCGIADPPRTRRCAHTPLMRQGTLSLRKMGQHTCENYETVTLFV